MAREVTYTYCGSEKRHTSDVAEMQRVVKQLTALKASLITNLAGWNGYLDFHVLGDGSTEMELYEREDDFATVDIQIAARVVEIAMTDSRDMPLREKLSGLPIRWLT
jgi:hypothetical protein